MYFFDALENNDLPQFYLGYECFYLITNKMFEVIKTTALRVYLLVHKLVHYVIL